MRSRSLQARWFALSLQSGVWNRAAITDRVTRVLPPEGPDPAQIASRIYFHFDGTNPPDTDSLAAFLFDEPLLENVFRNDDIRGLLLDPNTMAAKPDTFLTFPLPELPTWRDVGLWLCLSNQEVAWFADYKNQQSSTTETKLHHYRYSWIKKRSGALRLIETPKQRLKVIQRKVLGEILSRVPIHPAAHGFRSGRSIKTFVAPHTGQKVLLRMDLKDFFHSVPLQRISAVFRKLGYPPSVAWLLQGICTNSVSPSLAGKQFNDFPIQERKRLQSKHLPQGAPTSAALANLCAWRLDARLQGLADKLGYKYTRYADDLAFSGSRSLARQANFIEALVGSIALDEGFELNHRKTRLRLASQRQRLAGITINETTNCDRAEWDRLKATLYNCVKHGPKSQNRINHADFKSHLRGRIAHIAWLNPTRGKKLLTLWQQIDWDH